MALGSVKVVPGVRGRSTAPQGSLAPGPRARVSLEAVGRRHLLAVAALRALNAVAATLTMAAAASRRREGRLVGAALVGAAGSAAVEGAAKVRLMGKRDLAAGVRARASVRRGRRSLRTRRGHRWLVWCRCRCRQRR